MSGQTHSTAAAEFPEAQSENAEACSLYGLLAAYWSEFDTYERAMTATDSTADGTAEHEAAEAAQYEASDRLHDAGLAILAVVPRRKYEARIKTDFAMSLARDNLGSLNSDETAALLSSLPTLVAWGDGQDQLDRGMYGDREVGSALAEMLDAHARATDAINAHEGEPDHPEIVALCKQLNKAVLAICGYRPIAKNDEQRKADFLRVHFQHNQLSEEEQGALIGSLMPEGDEG